MYETPPPWITTSEEPGATVVVVVGGRVVDVGAAVVVVEGAAVVVVDSTDAGTSDVGSVVEVTVESPAGVSLEACSIRTSSAFDPLRLTAFATKEMSQAQDGQRPSCSSGFLRSIGHRSVRLEVVCPARPGCR
jgi:hypothetical protein